MVFLGMAIRTQGNQVICPVCSSVRLINNMMGLQDFVFLFTPLTSIMVPCEDKTPHIMIAMGLTLLIMDAWWVVDQWISPFLKIVWLSILLIVSVEISPVNGYTYKEQISVRERFETSRWQK